MKDDAAINELVSIVEILVKALVDKEADVSVCVIPERMHTNLNVKVAPTDFGKVLGRRPKQPNGIQTIEAIRHLVKAFGSKYQLPTCMFHIEDPRDTARRGGRYRDAT